MRNTEGHAPHPVPLPWERGRLKTVARDSLAWGEGWGEGRDLNPCAEAAGSSPNVLANPSSVSGPRLPWPVRLLAGARSPAFLGLGGFAHFLRFLTEAGGGALTRLFSFAQRLLDFLSGLFSHAAQLLDAILIVVERPLHEVRLRVRESLRKLRVLGKMPAPKLKPCAVHRHCVMTGCARHARRVFARHALGIQQHTRIRHLRADALDTENFPIPCHTIVSLGFAANRHVRGVVPTVVPGSRDGAAPAPQAPCTFHIASLEEWHQKVFPAHLGSR